MKTEVYATLYDALRAARQAGIVSLAEQVKRLATIEGVRTLTVVDDEIIMVIDHDKLLNTHFVYDVIERCVVPECAINLRKHMPARSETLPRFLRGLLQEIWS